VQNFKSSKPILQFVGNNLSEQAKLAYLQERIKEAKRNEWAGTLIFVIGMILILLYVSLPLFLDIRASLLFLYIGLPFAVLGMATGILYSRKYIALMRQLEKVAFKVSTCPKCGKELPQGSYSTCPFCGTSLES